VVATTVFDGDTGQRGIGRRQCEPIPALDRVEKCARIGLIPLE
jgi:hypothetical protein